MSLINTSGIPNKGNDAIQRGIQIASGLVKLLGLNMMQACAVAGYCMKESNCDPTSINKTEAASKGTGYANGANCGEGIAQWTNVAYKDQNLAAIGIGPGGHPGKIISLSLDQQIMMLAKGDLGKAYMQYGLNKATSLDYAVCCVCIQGHGSGHARSAYNAAGGNINSEEYVRAVMSKYGSGRQDIPRARKWAEQVLVASGGNPNEWNGGSAGGGSSHNWPDFNVQSFPILSDDKGKYTNEPLLLGIVNHLRIEGGNGGYGEDGPVDEGLLNEGTVNFDTSSIQVKNRNAYNLVLYRYEYGVGGSDGHRAVDGVIFELESKKILCYTIEDESDLSRNNLKKNSEPTEIIPGGNSWVTSDKYHLGQSKLTVDISGGKAPFGSAAGKPGTMLSVQRSPGCLFHYGKDTSWSLGCILIGNKPTNGKRNFNREAYADSNILNTDDVSLKFHKNFYRAIVPKICNGTTVNLYFQGIV